MSSAPHVGSAAWTAARLAWRDVATASARALIARRVDGLRRDSSEAPSFLEAGTHEVPTARGTLPPWPPGRDRESPEVASAHHRQRHRRHVVDGVWPADRCGALASSTASALAPLRDRHGEASVAALGWASRDVLGDDAFAEMRDALREMRREAERVFSFGRPEASVRGDEASPNGETGRDRENTTVATGKARRLFPVGALLTHIVPARVEGTPGHVAERLEDVFEKNAPPATPRASDARGYWSPHVDKANVPEYDVSAILYLSTGAKTSPAAEASEARAAETTPRAEFSGGSLVFLDESGGSADDETNEHGVALCGRAGTRARRVTPRRGRLVVFASGEENVHAVSVVETGARATLNLWLSADARVGADASVFDAELWSEGAEETGEK